MTSQTHNCWITKQERREIRYTDTQTDTADAFKSDEGKNVNR